MKYALMIATLCFVGVASGQNVQSTNLRFLSYGEVLRGWNVTSPPQNGKFSQPLPLPTVPNRFRSKPVAYKGGPVLWLFDGPVPAIEPGSPPPSATAEVEIPAGARDTLVVLFALPTPDAAGRRFVAVALDDSPSKFPYGNFLFFNLTPHELVGKIGDQIFQFAKGQTTVVNPGVPPGGVNITVFDPREKDRPLLQQVWDHQPKSRVVVFLREISKPKPFISVSSVAEFEGTAEEPVGPLDARTLSDQNP